MQREVTNNSTAITCTRTTRASFFHYTRDSHDDVHGAVGDVTHIDCDDEFGAGASGEHAENACAAADVEHDLVGEQRAVLVHAVAVELGPNAILNTAARGCYMNIRY